MGKISEYVFVSPCLTFRIFSANNSNELPQEQPITAVQQLELLLC